MSATAWILCAAALLGGDGKKGPDPKLRRLPLSSREAVSLSLNHNLDLEVARYEPWIEDQNIFIAMGAWDHVAYADLSGGRDVSPGTSSLSGATRLRTESSAVAVGVRKALPFGPSYDLSFSNDRFESNNAFLLLNPQWSQRATAAMTIPLLQGMGTAANTATLIIARHTRDSAVDGFEKSLTDTVYLVMAAYWDLVFVIENKKVKEQSLEVAVRLLEDTRRRLERGLAARIDVTQAEAGVASQQEGILTAEAEVQNAMDRLKRLVDPALLREEVVLVPVDAPRSQAAEIDERAATEQALAEAVTRRPEVRQVRLQLASQEAVMARAHNDRLPRLDLVGGGSFYGTEGTFTKSNREVREGDFYDYSVLLSFEYALENSAARGALRRAELEMQQLRLQERNLENQILVEVREAVRAIKTNEKRIEATRRARVLAQEQLDGELSRIEHGLSTTFRVLDSQEDLALARTNELKALIDYNLSGHKLHQVTGALLEKNGILLKENLQPRITLAGR